MLNSLHASDMRTSIKSRRSRVCIRSIIKSSSMFALQHKLEFIEHFYTLHLMEFTFRKIVL